jgi:TonB family protein
MRLLVLMLTVAACASSHPAIVSETVPKPTEAPRAAPPSPEGSTTPVVVDSARMTLVAGTMPIVLLDSVKEHAAKHNKMRLMITLKVCTDTNGVVSTAEIAESSGYEFQDNHTVTTIKETWRYRPYTVNGTPVPTCTPVRFVYLITP